MREPDNVVSTSPLYTQFFGWRRWAVGTAVVFGVMVLQILPSAVSRQPESDIALRITFLLVTIPLLMFALSASFHWATRRRLASGRTLLVSLLVAAVVGATSTLAIVYVALSFPSLGMQPERRAPYSILAAFGVVYGLIMCAVWALAFVYPFAAEDARLRALETEKLKLEAEKLRAAAELAHLRAQLEPHFLLNTLNAIAGLVTQDPREARRLLACLGDLLRDALHDADEMQTLDEEIAWLRRYADILESRHAGSLRFQWEIESPAENALLPRLLLQPLVENAVKHGALRRRGGGGTVLVRAVVTPAENEAAARLVCTIEDNGPGIPQAPPRSGAFGLRSVRRRLELKYEGAALRLESSPEGTRSIVELPCFLAEKQPRPATYVEVT
ncbi:sensor histidine kinase [Polyangium jinanense]|uniref:Histidine kinase n=1 Tax=Polyangium jinanense TaxID=2829994 RepID=A0A9X3XGE9_9BACT|nr:histidine kinase [Polyangium jinanense]MDC3988633.1 histidine kinase [Polyangium jinanense]